MSKKKIHNTLNVKKKNRIKVIRTIFQFVFLIITGTLLIQSLFFTKQYEEPNKQNWHNEDGFLAISYFGVSRSGTAKLISEKELDKQLGTLYDQGYTTISQQDIIDYYTLGKPLPKKALFLSFEDGRNDSSIFAQPILEKYNFKATFLSYANKVNDNDRKFVQPEDMVKMSKSGYWELGTNGYRLSYINVFDRTGMYLGNKTENELRNKEKIEYYNHYLMDFIRDENMIPLENRDEMTARITKDYQLMEEIYKKSLGYVPRLYMIMHANTLNNGMNPLVSAANNTNIEKLFQLHFNREGHAFNSKEDNMLDLTRIQPQPYWYTNHLLMRLKEDGNQTLKFIVGDKKRAETWQTESGATEFLTNKIVLTSTDGGAGRTFLKGSETFKDIKINVTLDGNVVGKQSIYVRTNKERDAYVKVMLDNNEIKVYEKKRNEERKLLVKKKLSPINWNKEDLRFDKAMVYSSDLIYNKGDKNEDEYPTNIKQKRNLEITVQNNQLNVMVDKHKVIRNINIDEEIPTGGFALESRYNKQNQKDKIYDAVFENLEVSTYDSDEKILYTNKEQGLKLIISKVKMFVNDLIDWAIDTF